MDKQKKLNQYPDLMNIIDICEYLNISRTTAYALIKNNDKIFTIKIGRQYKISKISFANFLNISLKE